jgi:predicted phage-related endonuclease
MKKTANHKSAPAAATTVPAVPAPAPVVVLTPSQVVSVEELGHVKRHIRTLEHRKEELSGEIKGVLRGTGGGVDDHGVLLASVAERAGRRSVDLARLALDFPKAYEACVSMGSPSEVLTLHNVR